MASLPITDTIPRIRYTATAGQTDFIIPFVFFALTDPAVYLTPVGTTANDYSNILIYTTNYSVVQNVNFTGTVTLNVPAAAGDIITIVRAMPDQRLNYYLQGGSFTADAVNTDFESEVLMIQQNQMYDKNLSPHYNLTANPLMPTIAGGQDIILPVLKANETWVKDPTNNFITATEVGNGGAVVTVVTQAAHGFIVGDVVFFNGNTNLYEKAKADTASDAEVIGIVSAVTDINTFKLTTSGSVIVLAGLSAGSVYFLSDVTAGTLSITEPTTVGHISKPLLIAVSASSGYFTNFRGKVIAAPSSTGQVSSIITQAAHGFIVGNVAYYSGAAYALALADNPTDAEVIGVVTQVIDANTFQLTTNGLINTLAGLTAGETYFLSDVTPGLLSLTEPTTVGHISKPLLVAVSTTSGYFSNYRGKVVASPGFSWNTVAVNTQMTTNKGYITGGGGTLILTLPTVMSVGDIIEVVGNNSIGWVIAQNAGQKIFFGNNTTSVGVGGSLASTNHGDSVRMVCVTANNELRVISCIGNITIV